MILPIELINEILCYLIDNTNYLDLMVLSKEITAYFGKYHKKMLKLYYDKLGYTIIETPELNIHDIDEEDECIFNRFKKYCSKQNNVVSIKLNSNIKNIKDILDYDKSYIDKNHAHDLFYNYATFLSEYYEYNSINDQLIMLEDYTMDDILDIIPQKIWNKYVKHHKLSYKDTQKLIRMNEGKYDTHFENHYSKFYVYKCCDDHVYTKSFSSKIYRLYKVDFRYPTIAIPIIHQLIRNITGIYTAHHFLYDGASYIGNMYINGKKYPILKAHYGN